MRMDGDRPDGTTIFVYTDCRTRQPLAPEFQDPIYREPGVPLDRGTLQTTMQSWVQNTCRIRDLPGSLDTDDRQVEIRGTGFADNSLGEYGAVLKEELSKCGRVAAWSFEWEELLAFDWVFKATILDNPDPGCVGQAVLNVGGVTKDGCVTSI